MKLITRCFSFLLAFFIFQIAVSQSSDITSGDLDSIQWQQQLIQKYEQLLKTERTKKIRDSIKQANFYIQAAETGKLREQELETLVGEIEVDDSIRNAARREKMFGLKDGTKGFPVAPFSDTLFHVYLKIGPISPEERAASVSDKILLLYRDNKFVADSLKVVDNESTIDIVYRDLIVTSITDWDALWFELESEELARKYADQIKESIKSQRQSKSLANILIKVGLVIGILLAVFGVIILINRLFDRIMKWLKTKKDSFFKGIKLRTYEFLTPSRQLSVSLSIVNLFKWLVVVLTLYISLPIIFSIFPFTQGWASTLFAWIWNPARNIALAVIKFLPNIFSIAVIFIAIRYLVKFFGFLSKEVESERLNVSGFHPEWAAPTFGIVRVLLYAFMFIAIFPFLPGSDSPIFKGVSVFLGIIFSLGSSTAISNAVSGLVITYMRPFRIGDRIRIGDITGDVMEKSVLVTRIRTIKNEYITVPNASVLSGHTVNYSTSKETKEGLIVHTTVTIGYDVPWRDVHDLMIKAANETKEIDTTKEPFVLQTSLDDYYVSYQLNAYTFSPEKMVKIYSELHKNILDLFNEAGVEILSPQYHALRDGNQITTPTEFLPENYTTPPFNVKSTK